MKKILQILGLSLLLNPTRAITQEVVNESVSFIQNSRALEKQFEDYTTTRKKISSLKQRDLIVNALATIDQGVRYGLQQEILSPDFMSAMARLGFYTTRNDGGRLARRLLTRLYMRHGPSLRVAVQGLPTEQRQFLFSEIAKGRKQEAYAQAIEPKKGARAPQSK